MSGSNSFIMALALPVIGLGASWAVTHHRAQQGTDWDVPIRGYDPRDLLRGHYIAFQYDWPGLAEDADPANFDALCIKGTAPAIASTSRAGENTVPGQECAAIARASVYRRDGLARDIFYVPQTQAGAYESKLRDPKQQGVLRVRIRNDGLIRPLSLSFRARPPSDR